MRLHGAWLRGGGAHRAGAAVAALAASFNVGRGLFVALTPMRLHGAWLRGGGALRAGAAVAALTASFKVGTRSFCCAHANAPARRMAPRGRRSSRRGRSRGPDRILQSRDAVFLLRSRQCACGAWLRGGDALHAGAAVAALATSVVQSRTWLRTSYASSSGVQRSRG